MPLRLQPALALAAEENHQANDYEPTTMMIINISWPESMVIYLFPLAELLGDGNPDSAGVSCA
jgi:hypothetical protein